MSILKDDTKNNIETRFLEIGVYVIVYAVLKEID